MIQWKLCNNETQSIWVCKGPSDTETFKAAVFKNTYISQRDKERQHMHEEHCKEKKIEFLIEYKTKDTAF